MPMHKAGYPFFDYLDSEGEDSGNMTSVLIVDDRPGYRGIIRSHLTRDASPHFVLSETGSGEEDLRAVTTIVPDCILLDYHLPDMNGLAVFEKIKRMDVLRDTSVIILTGNGSEETAVRAMKMGAVNYLNKDIISREMFMSAVEHAVKRKHLRESLRLRSGKKRPDADGFLDSITAIAAKTAAVAGRVIETNENLKNDPDMTIILGKSKELLSYGDV